MSRVLICGGPRAGKTTLAHELAQDALHTDDLIETHDWSEVSRVVASDWMRRPGPWVIEGVAAVRALRKFLVMFPGESPCDEILWCGTAMVERTPGQERMAKACETIWKGIDLAGLDVRVTAR